MTPEEIQELRDQNIDLQMQVGTLQLKIDRMEGLFGWMPAAVRGAEVESVEGLYPARAVHLHEDLAQQIMEAAT